MSQPRLPVDVLRLIVDYFEVKHLDTSNRDLQEVAWENHKTLLGLAATCHNLRTLVKPILSQSWWYREGCLESKQELVELIDVHERLQNLRYVFINTAKRSNDADEGVSQIHALLSSGDITRSLFITTLQERPHLLEFAESLVGQAGQDDWVIHLRLGSLAAWLGLLLSLMPRLHFLHVSTSFGDGDPLNPLWSHLQKQRHNPAMLPSLEELVLDGTASFRSTSIDTMRALRLLGMSSIKRLRLRPVCIPGNPSLFLSPDDYPRAQLTHLDMQYSFMDNGLMGIIATHLTSLQSFRFTWKLGHNDQSPANETHGLCGPDAMIRALQRRADTLQHLVLDARHHELPPFPPISTLKNLHNLRYLEITPTVLLGRDTSLSREPRNFATVWESTSSDSSDSDPVVDSLPASLKHVVLHDPQSKNYGRTVSWLGDMLRRWDTFGPGLVTLDIREWTTSVQRLVLMDRVFRLRSIRIQDYGRSYCCPGGSKRRSSMCCLIGWIRVPHSCDGRSRTSILSAVNSTAWSSTDHGRLQVATDPEVNLDTQFRSVGVCGDRYDFDAPRIKL